MGLTENVSFNLGQQEIYVDENGIVVINDANGSNTTTAFLNGGFDPNTVYTKAQTYNKAEVNAIASGETTNLTFQAHTADTSIHFTKSSINLSDLGSSAHTHTIDNIIDLQESLDNKQDVSAMTSYYTSTEVDGLLNDKQDLSGMTDYYRSTQSDARYSQATNWLNGVGTGSVKGINCITNGNFCVAEGNATTASGYYGYSHSEGESSQALTDSSHAEGVSTLAGSYPMQNGSISGTSFIISSSLGNLTSIFNGVLRANIYNSIDVIKYFNKTIDSIIFNGINTIVYFTENIGSDDFTDVSFIFMLNGAKTHAEGSGTSSYGESSHAEGINTIAFGSYSHAEGGGSQSINQYSHAEGLTTLAYGNASHAEGGNTITGRKNYTIYNNTLSYDFTAGTINYLGNATSLFVIGSTFNFYNSYNYLDSSVLSSATYVPAVYASFNGQVSGMTTDILITADNLGVVGNIVLYQNGNDVTTLISDWNNNNYGNTITLISGDGSQIPLEDIILTGGTDEYTLLTINPISDYIMIYFTNSYNFYYDNGDYGHAEGQETIASGSYGAHAEGYQTIASGDASHAGGSITVATGNASHTFGYLTNSLGAYSYADGRETTASGDTSFVHSTSSIIGGDRSAIIGGQNIYGSANDTVYVPQLEIVYGTDSALIMTDVYDGLRYKVILSGGTFVISAA